MSGGDVCKGKTKAGIGTGSAAHRLCFTWIEIKFPPECQDSLCYRLGAHHNERDALCYVMATLQGSSRKQRQCPQKGPDLLLWSFSVMLVLGKWGIPSPQPAEGGCQAVIIHRVPHAVHCQRQRWFLCQHYLWLTASQHRGGGGGWAGKQQQLLMEVLWLKMNKGNFLVVFVAFSSILSLIGSLHGS